MARDASNCPCLGADPPKSKTTAGSPPRRPARDKILSARRCGRVTLSARDLLANLPSFIRRVASTMACFRPRCSACEDENAKCERGRRGGLSRSAWSARCMANGMFSIPRVPGRYTHRSSLQVASPGEADIQLRMKEICRKRVRYGYPREGWMITQKKTRRGGSTTN